jgi:ribonuclease P protein component
VRGFRAFGALAASAHRAHRGPVTVRRVPAHDGPVHVAYAIGRGVGTAVVRNRLRRQARAVMADLDLSPGMWLVALGPGSTRCTYEQLYAHIEDAVAEIQS